MQDTRIVVCIPTYEPHPIFLGDAIQSLLSQTERQWVCYIIDDASMCDVHALVRPYLSDPRITFLRNPVRRGIGGNWNACLQCSLSPRERVRERGHPHFVQFLFQDDFWYPWYLERSCAILDENPDIGFVASAHAYRSNGPVETMEGYKKLEEEKKSSLPPGRHEGRQFLQQWIKRGLEKNVIGEPSFVMMRRSLVEEVGPFFQDLHQLLDVEYWVRALLVTDWYYHPEESGIFRVHRKGASYQHFLKGEQMSEHLRLLERLRGVLPIGTLEREQLESTLDERFAVIIKHVVNRCIRGQGIGTGALPVLHHFQKYPAAACRGMQRYVVQASSNWLRKGKEFVRQRRSG